MAMGRSFRVFHNLAQVGQGNPYSLVLEQVRYSGYTNQADVLIFHVFYTNVKMNILE